MKVTKKGKQFAEELVKIAGSYEKATALLIEIERRNRAQKGQKGTGRGDLK